MVSGWNLVLFWAVLGGSVLVLGWFWVVVNGSATVLGGSVVLAGFGVAMDGSGWFWDGSGLVLVGYRCGPGWLLVVLGWSCGGSQRFWVVLGGSVVILGDSGWFGFL
jgi:hypothetical protein